MTEQMQISDPPKFSDEQIKKCRESGDFMPMLFEWYKFVGHLCIFFALIKSESPAVRDFPSIQYSVLTGLLNRCSRLMLANIALSHNGRFGETTALLDRCIFESCGVIVKSGVSASESSGDLVNCFHLDSISKFYSCNHLRQVVEAA